jgi:serine/threonine-protein kinase
MHTTNHLNAALAGTYAIERELGRGGMATVFLARDIKHQRQVALKVLDPELGAVLGAERFLSEIRVTANLQHPNLLPLFDSGEANGLLYYVMPFVEGETLRARLEREKQLPVDESVRIAVAVANALDYAHRSGVVHRDLKPENILLREGQPLVADFGIALAVSNAGGARVTQTGLSLGTPQYMSPEQATGDRTIDGRTDIYSLASVLYEMLAGDPPFTGSTAQAIIARVLTDTPRNIRAARSAVPLHVEWAMTRAMEKLPADRWPTARQFAEALGDPALMTRAGVTPASAAGSQSSRVRTPVVVAAAIVGAAVCVAIGAALHARIASRSEPQRSPVRFAIALDSNQSLGGPNAIAISPDGRTIAYAAATAGGWRKLFVRPVDELKAREIAGTEGASDPFFSPDGRTIGFTSGEGAAFRLKTVSVSGGSPVVLTNIDGRFGGASWTRAETIVIGFGNSIATISAAGGTPRRVAAPDTAGGESTRGTPLSPLLLSDGKTVLYASQRGSNPANSRIAVASISGGASRRLDLVGTAPLAVIDGILIYRAANGVVNGVTFDERRAEVTGTPVPLLDAAAGSTVLTARVSPSGSLVYTSGELATEARIVDTRGNTRPLIAGVRGYSHPRFSPDGKRLAVTIAGDIFIYDLTAETLTPITTDAATNDRAEWTPDGKRVTFMTGVGNPVGQVLRVRPADLSAAAEDLFRLPGIGFGEGLVSPDNQYLVIRISGGNGYREDIVYRRMTGDTALKPLVVSPFNDYAPRVSPDGKWVAYSSDVSGADQIYITPLPGPGPHYQVSTNGGQQPVWSRDGRKVFFLHGGQLEAATVTLSPFQVTSREVLPVTGVGGGRVHANYDVSPDGQHFVVFRRMGPSASAVVVYSWMSEVRARMSLKQ